MFSLKPLPAEAVEAALGRAGHYRLLNEPKLAESICLDVLEVAPDNQRAMVSLLLARSDQFSMEGGARMEEARALLAGLRNEYERYYYAGIICERWATALLTRHQPGSGSSAYCWFRKAMSWYEKAEPLWFEARKETLTVPIETMPGAEGDWEGRLFGTGEP